MRETMSERRTGWWVGCKPSPRAHMTTTRHTGSLPKAFVFLISQFHFLYPFTHSVHLYVCFCFQRSDHVHFVFCLFCSVVFDSMS